MHNAARGVSRAFRSGEIRVAVEDDDAYRIDL
jgi:hypothetical protein